MTGAGAIDQIITGVYKLALLDGDNTDRRARILEWLQEIVERIWYGKSWAWRRAVEDPFTLSSGTQVVPSGFQAVGETRKGGVWVKSTGARLVPVTEERMRDLLNVPGGAGSGDPTCYAVYGLNTSDLRVNLVCNTTASTQLILAYEQSPPTMTDDSNDTDLSKIPTAYHQSAIMPCLRSFARTRVGDQDVDDETAILRAIGTIARAERPDSDGPKQSPSFFDGVAGGYR